MALLFLVGNVKLHVSKSSYFLGDPPPDPRFLASLGGLSLVELPWSRGSVINEEVCFIENIADITN